VDLVENKPANLELVLTGGHEEPAYLLDSADLVTEVRKQKHPIEAGQGARGGRSSERRDRVVQVHLQ